MTTPLLHVENLTVCFGETPVVHDVSFHVNRGETVCIVGESGSGKSITALSIPGLLPHTAHITNGSVTFDGQNLMGVSESALQSIRGKRIGMIFQEPLSALNPVHTIFRQTAECITTHDPSLSKEDVASRANALFQQVGLPRPDSIGNSYPHQLSGGQRQRVMIAMALANTPDMLIADEPTTALDVTVQRQILDLIQDLARQNHMAVMFITHDLGVVRHMADRAVVMHAGAVVEDTDADALFANPQAAYTRHLMHMRPHGKPTPVDANAETVIEAENIRVHFPIKTGVLRRTTGYVKAVDGIDVSIRTGETVGVVGESGSGKSTLGFALLGLLKRQGRVTFNGQDMSTLSKAELRALRSQIQVVFQDPFGSLSPRLTVADIIGEGLAVHRADLSQQDREEMITRQLIEVGLDPEMRHRYPHEFSGGQRQRIAIARAMILDPKLVVLDEPTSALDVSVQADVIDLLRRLQHSHGLAYLFISHDMAVVRAMAHRVMVMKDGVVVEHGVPDDVLCAPTQSYTRALIDAILPIPEPV